MFRITTHLWLSLFWFVAASLGLLFFLQNIDPDQAGIPHFAALYTGAFLWVFGIATIVGYFLRRILWWKGMKYEQLVNSRRQAGLFGFLTVIFLILQAASILNVWSTVFLVAIFVLIELYVQ